MKKYLITISVLAILSTVVGCTQHANRTPAAGGDGTRISAVAPIQSLASRIDALKTHYDPAGPGVQSTLAQLEATKLDEETAENEEAPEVDEGLPE